MIYFIFAAIIFDDSFRNDPMWGAWKLDNDDIAYNTFQIDGRMNHLKYYQPISTLGWCNKI